MGAWQEELGCCVHVPCVTILLGDTERLPKRFVDDDFELVLDTFATVTTSSLC